MPSLLKVSFHGFDQRGLCAVLIRKSFHDPSVNRVLCYAKQLRKYVENRDSSFESNIRKALVDCEEIMKPFLEKWYVGDYAGNIFNLSAQMGEFRNGIAHSRLDLRYEAIHLSDVRIVEELLYAMRLKKIGLQTSQIQKAISDLFVERIAV